MNIWAILKVGLRSLQRNKLRTFLTALGMIIGVGAVVAMVSIGQGAKASVDVAMNNLGSNILMIIPGSTFTGGVRGGGGTRSSLIDDDTKAIVKEVSSVYLATSQVRSSAQIVFSNLNWFTQVWGVEPTFSDIRNWDIGSGSFFTDQDVLSSNKVAVLGKTVADNLFGGMDPIGNNIRIKKVPFKVVGVLIPKGQSHDGRDQDDTVLVPYTTAQKKLAGITYLNNILVKATSLEATETAKQEISSLLRVRHRITKDSDDDFSIISMADIADARRNVADIFTRLLAGIASVSLVVGGIGIMNIMLVSVTERTREIGIRMAVGARSKDIMFQFLVEAMALSLSGGIIGIILGVVGSRSLSILLGWPTLISIESGVVAFLLSGLIGIFFGLYPAKKASMLDPIESLRYE